MAPPASASPGAQQLPTATALFLLLLANGGPSTEGCLHCGQQFKNLRSRFAHLCARFRERFQQGTCTKFPWGTAAVRDFALDESSLDLLLEKAHRVFRVIEIKHSFADVPKFWNWLHERKIPEEMRAALCPPVCHGVASLFNCSTCRRKEIPCWAIRTCYPEHQGLPKVIRLLLFISSSCFFLGVVSCALEFWLHPDIGTNHRMIDIPTELPGKVFECKVLAETGYSREGNAPLNNEKTTED